jgi:GR25 family glycosyltransferase involved in LPS biosynthesis
MHYKSLVDRKKILKDFFNRHAIELEWVEKYSPEEVKSQYRELVGEFKIDPNAKAVCQNQYTYYENAGRLITVPELSLYMKHKYAINQQYEKGYKHVLMLEDDVSLPENFIPYVNRCIKEWDAFDADLLFLGAAHNFHVKDAKPEQYVYLNKNQLTRCTHAYIVNIKCAKKILDNSYPINWQWDFKLNEIIIKEKLKVCWAEPCIYQDKAFPGSIKGIKNS